MLSTWWKRWHEEYLHDLRNFHCKTESSTRKVKVGEVVLIHQDSVKRQLWNWGIVVKLYSGADGRVRAADLRTANGVISRPVQRLYPMEVALNEVTGIEDDAGSSVQEDTVREIRSVSNDRTGEDVGTGPAAPAYRLTRRGRLVRPPRRYQDEQTN